MLIIWAILSRVWVKILVLKGIENNVPIDIIELDIKNEWNLLGTITGESYEEELLDKLFSQFCLGK